MAPESLRLVVATVCAGSALALLGRRLAQPSALALLACACTLAMTGATDTSSAPHWAVSSLVTPLAPLCGAVAGLWWPVRRVIGALLLVGSFALAAGLVAGALHGIAFDPAATGCSRCPDNLLAVTSTSQHADGFDRMGTMLVVLAGLLLAGCATARWWQSSPWARRTDWPMLLGGAGVAAVAAVHSLRLLTKPTDLFDEWAAPATNAQLMLLLLISAGALWRLSLPRRITDRVARRVLAATPEPAALLASLAREIGDPTLVVTYRRLEGQRIDLTGCLAAAPPGRAVVRLTREGVTYAELWYAARLAQRIDVVRAVTESAGLALEYIAAQARLKAEVLDAVAARRRVVATADAERGRLERDLHDGAQQGLISLSLQLTGEPSGGSPGTTEAQAEISAALQDLRHVARGLFPVSLREGGLEAALRELGDHTLVPLVVQGKSAQAGAEADKAFYDVVVDVTSATPEAPGALVRVDLGGADGTARLQVTATPPDPDRARRLLVRAEDRVAALGGTLSVVVTGEILAVTGEVPCAL